MKKYLSCVLLCTAIMLISVGIHTDDIIIISIGGLFAGAYNAMIYKQGEQKPAETEKGTNGNEREIPNSDWSDED